MSAAINRGILLKTRTGPTETVDTGEAYFWLEGQSIKYKDDTQTVKTLATGVTPEEVQDIVGTFITSGNNRITAVYNDAGNSFVITLVEANIVHQNLSGAGTNTHAQIDSHIANTSNPHATTAAQVGADPVGTASAAVAAHVAAGDPHPQYLTPAEGNAAYQPLDGDLTAVAALAGAGFAVRTTTNTWTTRSIIAGTGIGVADSDGVFASPTISNTDRGSTAITSHLAAADPHPQYLTQSEGDALYTNTPLSSTAPTTVGTTNAIGVGTTAARADHTHAHGAQTDPALHAVATTSVNGFMSSSDKTKLDGVAASATNTPLASTAPANLNTTAAVGVGTTAARADHVHAFPTAANVGADPAGTASTAVAAHVAAADPHTQYALLAGRAGGQTLNGGTAASNNLVLESTTNATKGFITLAASGGSVGVGTSSPGTIFEIRAQSPVSTLKGTLASGTAFLDVRNDTSNFLEVGLYGSTNTGSVFGDSTAGKAFITSSATGPLVIGNFGAQPIIFGTSSLERVKVAGTGEVTIGGVAGSALTNNPLSVNGTVNSFLQSNLQNTSTGTSASGDMVVTADNGTDTTNYIDMGINNSTYSDPSFTINGPNDGYLYVQGGDLSIGTASANKIVFFTGDTLAANERARITPTGQLALGVTAPNAASKFQIDSTTQGFLMPRMTTTQMEAVTTPPAGMQVYNTDLKCVATYDGAKWLFEFSLVVQNNQATTSNTYANITELVTASLPIGRYAFRFVGACQSTATTTGVGVRLGAGSATISALVADWEISQAGSGTDKNFQYSQLSAAENQTSVSVATANADFPVSGEGVFSLSVAGTVAAQIRSETNGVGVSVRINSVLKIWRVTG